MFDLFKKSYLVGLGLAYLTKDKIEEVVDELIKRGEVAEKDRHKVVDSLLARARDEQQKLSQTVRDNVNKVVGELRGPSREQWDSLVKRVEALEKDAHSQEGLDSENASPTKNG
jgi:polyhydroxyalkanoate synthesis regulator phasin